MSSEEGLLSDKVVNLNILKLSFENTDMVFSCNLILEVLDGCEKFVRLEH